ncbi:lanthionine synthetase LanC family protein [Streptococcus caprae]|uniref:Lanthionine synthetase LanC family protein n=1 Tax=Streptococcus caprae TaxID=1640501 RepID=A0ABV8CY79_9STRE
MQQKTELELISIKDCLENFSNFEDISLLNGTSGYLLLLLNLYSIDKNIYYEELAISVIRKTNLNFVVNRENRGLWSGPLGFAFVLNLWSRYSNNEIFEQLSQELNLVAESIIRTFLEDKIEDFQRSENIDIIYGLAGGLIYFTSLKTYNRRFRLPNDLMEKIVEIFDKLRIYEIATTVEAGRQSLKNRSKGNIHINFSMSHGIISLVNSLTFFDFSNINFYRYSLDFIENVYKQFSNLSFRISEYIAIDETMKITPIYSRDTINYSWCYGLYGHYIFLKNNDYVIKDDLLKMLLEEAQRLVRCRKKTNNVSFCHGLSGTLYSCCDVITPDESEEFVKLIESNYFDNEVLSEYSEWGILDGKLGIALVTLSLKFKRRIIGEEIFGINCNGDIS